MFYYRAVPESVCGRFPMMCVPSSLLRFLKHLYYGYESMVQRVYRQIKQINPDANVTIATSKAQVSVLHNQLDSEIGISIEPERKDTFPAIALAMAYLHDVKKVGLDEPVVVCPVDPYVEEDYFQAIQTLSDLVEKDLARIVLMGMEPKGPSEKFGRHHSRK